MACYCKWWDCTLEQVDEHQHDQCVTNGRDCVQCMEQADEEEDAGK